MASSAISSTAVVAKGAAKGGMPRGNRIGIALVVVAKAVAMAEGCSTVVYATSLRMPLAGEGVAMVAVAVATCDHAKHQSAKQLCHEQAAATEVVAATPSLMAHRLAWEANLT